MKTLAVLLLMGCFEPKPVEKFPEHDRIVVHKRYVLHHNETFAGCIEEVHYDVYFIDRVWELGRKPRFVITEKKDDQGNPGLEDLGDRKFKIYGNVYKTRRLICIISSRWVLPLRVNDQ